MLDVSFSFKLFANVCLYYRSSKIRKPDSRAECACGKCGMTVELVRKRFQKNLWNACDQQTDVLDKTWAFVTRVIHHTSTTQPIVYSCYFTWPLTYSQSFRCTLHLGENHSPWNEIASKKKRKKKQETLNWCSRSICQERSSVEAFCRGQLSRFNFMKSKPSLKKTFKIWG